MAETVGGSIAGGLSSPAQPIKSMIKDMETIKKIVKFLKVTPLLKYELIILFDCVGCKN